MSDGIYEFPRQVDQYLDSVKCIRELRNGTWKPFRVVRINGNVREEKLFDNWEDFQRENELLKDEIEAREKTKVP